MDEVVETNTEEPKIESLEDLQRIAEGEVQEQVETTSEEEVETPVDEPPAYEPNFSYTVRDEQREFDERIRSAIKDKETEDLVRELYTKADGLEGYKSRYASLDQDFAAIKQQAEALTGGFNTLKTLRDKSDYRGLQKALGLDPDFIVNWGLKLLEEDELPPEQKAALDKQREMEARIAEQESRISQFETSAQERRVEDDVQELKTLAASETYLPVVRAMNERGLNFADLVVSAGNLEFQQTGKEPSVKEVVERVAKQYEWLVPTATEVPAQVETAPPAPQQTTTQQKPTLPSLDSVNQAVVEKPVTSMDDLRKLAESL